MVSLESGPSVPLMPGEGAVCWVLMGTPALGCPWSAVSKARRPRVQRWKMNKGAHSEAVYHQLANVHWVSTAREGHVAENRPPSRGARTTERTLGPGKTALCRFAPPRAPSHQRGCSLTSMSRATVAAPPPLPCGA